MREVNTCESVGAEIMVAGGMLVVVFVVRCVAGIVLLLLLALLVAALLVEHLVKEATELGVDKREE